MICSSVFRGVVFLGFNCIQLRRHPPPSPPYRKGDSPTSPLLPSSANPPPVHPDSGVSRLLGRNVLFLGRGTFFRRLGKWKGGTDPTHHLLVFREDFVLIFFLFKEILGAPLGVQPLGSLGPTSPLLSPEVPGHDFDVGDDPSLVPDQRTNGLPTQGGG